MVEKMEMNHPLRVTLLGSFAIETDRGRLTDEENHSLKLWSVLAFLIVNRERQVSHAELLETFWRDEEGNSTGALKTLFYRLRAMLRPLLGEGMEAIVSRRGAYGWNPELACEVDAERFEELSRMAGNKNLSTEQQREFYREALSLYQGEYLPKLSNDSWVTPRRSQYHSHYIETVCSYSTLLEQERDYEEMGAICRTAVQRDPLEEELYVYLIRSLIGQGQLVLALDQYKQATELLYRSLGTHPSMALRTLYQSLMAEENSVEQDLAVIQNDLREEEHKAGAFFCEYGFYREAYRLISRQAARSGMSVHIVLYTLTDPERETPDLEELSAAMEGFQRVLCASLRRGDVVSRYSGSQFVVMLPNAGNDDSVMVAERVLASFREQYPEDSFRISYSVRSLEQDEKGSEEATG